MIFESQNSIDDALFVIRYMMNITFPLHLHRSFEYVEQICGSTEITVNDQKHLLKPGDAVLIFPLQSHSYTTIINGRIRICIFSPSFVTHFYKSKENKLPENNKFKCILPQTIPSPYGLTALLIFSYVAGSSRRSETSSRILL